MPNPIMELLAAINGSPQDLGMSPQSQVTGQALDAAQAQGIKPPLPSDGGMPPMLQLLQILSQMSATGANDTGFTQPSVNPDPGFTPPNDSVAGDLQALNSPSPASANSPQTMALLKALLESSIAE